MKRLLVSFSLLLVVLGLSLSASAAGTQGVFIIRCDPSHERAADPIVSPGIFPSSHEHQFFGSTTTNEFSTQASMEASSSTCKDHLDTAGYWVPTLYIGNTYIKPIFSFAYYHGDAQTKPFPEGLKMVTGGVSDPRYIWSCFKSGGNFSTPHTCTGGSGDYMTVRIKFPECWDGVHLDSPDHRSHMARAKGSTCPAGFPVKVPQINLFIRYPAGLDGANARLSDGTIALHADFWNTWNQAELARLVSTCLNVGKNCGQVTG